MTVVGAGAEARVTATPQTIGPPGAPREPTLSSGDGKVILQWFPPRLTGARAIQRYEYRFDAEDFGKPWIPIPASAPGGANHGRYEIARTNRRYAIVYLRAVNSEGAGAEVHRGTMPFAGAPGPPGNFSATLISDNEFELSWTAPAAAPGVTIVGYIIDGSPDGVTDWNQRTYEIDVPGTTSMTGRIGLRTGYFRIRTQFQMDTPTVVDGQEFSWGMSDMPPVVRVGPGETSVDPALPQIRVWDAFAREGRDLAVVFTVRLVPASTSTVTVDYRTEDVRANATDPADYWETSGTLTFAPGETEKTVSVRRRRRRGQRGGVRAAAEQRLGRASRRRGCGRRDLQRGGRARGLHAGGRVRHGDRGARGRDRGHAHRRRGAAGGPLHPERDRVRGGERRRGCARHADRVVHGDGVGRDGGGRAAGDLRQGAGGRDADGVG